MPVKVVWRGEQVSKDVAKAAAAGLFEFANHILEEARRIVPHDEGNLEKDSGVSMGEEGGHEVATVWFGAGAASAYAVRQHEETGYNHPNGRQAKYLETPCKEHAGEMPMVIGGNVKEVLS